MCYLTNCGNMTSLVWGVSCETVTQSLLHYSDVIMGTIASQITSVSIVYLTVSMGADQRKHQSSASLAFVWGIHRWPVNSPRKWPVTRKKFPFDDVIMTRLYRTVSEVWNMTSYWLFLSALWLADLNRDWETPWHQCILGDLQCIMGSRGRWEFPSFF